MFSAEERVRFVGDHCDGIRSVIRVNKDFIYMESLDHRQFWLGWTAMVPSMIVAAMVRRKEKYVQPGHKWAWNTVSGLIGRPGRRVLRTEYGPEAARLRLENKAQIQKGRGFVLEDISFGPIYEMPESSKLDILDVL